MATTAKTWREVSADGSRPLRTLTDAVIEGIQDTADAVARWAWVKAYERAERHYWAAAQGENKE
jgi:hypothetical protein